MVPLVIQCGAGKLAGLHRVADLYTGPLWSTLRAVERESGIRRPVYVYSAALGILPIDAVVESYDAQLAERPSLPHHVSPAQSARQLVEQGWAGRHVEFVGSALYAETMQRAGLVVTRLEDRGIGYMRQALRLALAVVDTSPTAPAEEPASTTHEGATTVYVCTSDRYCDEATTFASVEAFARYCEAVFNERPTLTARNGGDEYVDELGSLVLHYEPLGTLGEAFVAAAMLCGEYDADDLRTTWSETMRSVASGCDGDAVELADLYAHRATREDLPVEQRLSSARAAALVLEAIR